MRLAVNNDESGFIFPQTARTASTWRVPVSMGFQVMSKHHAAAARKQAVLFDRTGGALRTAADQAGACMAFDFCVAANVETSCRDEVRSEWSQPAIPGHRWHSPRAFSYNGWRP
jgi:hypothetical protein